MFSRRTISRYTGKIYNYIILKWEPKKKGFQVRMNYYTEVILATYSVLGANCLLKFNGMLAFALWDK